MVRTATYASSAVADVGVSTHTAPENMAALAPARPSCSDPAIGCPGTYLGSSTAATIDALTLPTSVTQPAVAASASLTATATPPTGVATTVSSALGSKSPTTSATPRSMASASTPAARSTPVMCQPCSRSANATEPPIRPSPTTLARRAPVPLIAAVSPVPLIAAVSPVPLIAAVSPVPLIAAVSPAARRRRGGTRAGALGGAARSARAP